MLALRLLPTAAEKDIMHNLLESFRPSIRKVIRVAFPLTFGDLMDRAVEAKINKAEDQPRKETKKYENRMTTASQRGPAPGDDQRRRGPTCHYCSNFYFQRGCPFLRAERKNALQENWLSSPDSIVQADLLSVFQMRTLGPNPPHVQLATRGAILKSIGSIVLSLQIRGKHYPGIFYVSRHLENEIEFGIPWFEEHCVIYKHCLGCIHLEARCRNRVYLKPKARPPLTKVSSPARDQPVRRNTFPGTTNVPGTRDTQGYRLRQNFLNIGPQK